ncbi:Glutamyl-Q tRNA(Asp) synthetase [Vibrio stylophorae]|uniref:Glutamyl-Q tRNA(Asp) synthetase n=1 Tax=Vibrio stylophorae TaxID=659351 RepID=A0ABM8ZQT1_9VIBR|nr:tRNA glutamyl-Q(34) synthetase GluQRS [Vibrio stylophorae]CAH0532634.1 Glutamyl-Q tRNA(Asp) synthetase [Vibrio stylophorae]
MSAYIGRFAPSPSGPLHFGSLVAALGSYLQAKSQQGQWLVRIEDIDPPREVVGASSLILKTLDAYGLHWDGTVRYQSEQLARYQAQIDAWLNTGQAYYCHCTRKTIQAMGGIYQGHCRDLGLGPEQAAVRLRLDHPYYAFDDGLQGHIEANRALVEEDLLIRRRDGLYAYNLAVVMDDIDQGVTEIVRGADLIEPTVRQMALYRQLGVSPVNYVHLPLIVNADGQKLSKQNHAPAIDINQPQPALVAALRCLGLELPAALHRAPCEEMLRWAIGHWQLQQLPVTTKISLPF